jgi:uncharacterized protein (TIGR04222 family)
MVVGYAVAVAALLIAGLAARFFARSGRGVGTDREPGAEEVAVLLDGRTRAVYASLAAHRIAGRVDVKPDFKLAATGSGSAGSTLDAAVHDAVRRGVRVKNLTSEVSVALDEVQAAVERTGWQLTDRLRRAAEAGKWPMLVAVVAGAVTVAVTLVRDEPVGVGLPALIAVAALAGLGFRKAPKLSRSGGRAVERLRSRYGHLAPEHRPAFRTYGPEAAAMAVALFGAPVLWHVDSALAMSLGLGRRSGFIKREPSSTVAASGSGGNCGNGCGDGCGGCGE